MEKSIENEGFDLLMEKYNFDSPIEVTVVIEEEEPPETVLLTDLIVSNNTNVSNANVHKTSSELSKKTHLNIDNVQNKIFNAKKNCNSKHIVEENNHSISVSKTIFPEGHQEDSRDIQWKLLDAVADNLIHITKCYYHNFINNKKQIENTEKLKLEYLTFKHYFFDLSYSTTIAILLPQENNILFFKDFIHRVIKIANRSSWFQISYKMLDKLIRDMFIWTKRKKRNLDLKFGSHNHVKGFIDYSPNALRIINSFNQTNQNLNRSIDNGPITNYAMQGTNTLPDFISKTHLPVHLMNISPNITHINNYSKQELTTRTRRNYPIEDTHNPTGSEHIKNNFESKTTQNYHSNPSETSQSQSEINISPIFVQRANRGTSNPITTEHRVNNSMQRITSMPYISARTNYSTETNNFSNRQALKTSKILLSSGPPNQKIIISVDSEILASINYQSTNQLNNNAIECHVNEDYGMNSTKRQKTNDTSYYPYSNCLSCHNENNLHCNENNSSATNLKSPVNEPCYDDSRRDGNELLNTETLRSSISRDSGCFSPTYGSFRNEQTFETPNNEEQGTPVISHVTSMNPNAVHISVRFCKVCGATTNNMCIGCYQKYYCSISCQTKDWENHRYICGIYR